jgi:hypothetical protein
MHNPAEANSLLEIGMGTTSFETPANIAYRVGLGSITSTR